MHVAQGRKDILCESSNMHALYLWSFTLVANLTPFTSLSKGNAGDSRSVLCNDGQAVPLSFDHLPTNKGELLSLVECAICISRV